jgi:hypothetical protein
MIRNKYSQLQPCSIYTGLPIGYCTPAVPSTVLRSRYRKLMAHRTHNGSLLRTNAIRYLLAELERLDYDVQYGTDINIDD